MSESDWIAAEIWFEPDEQNPKNATIRFPSKDIVADFAAGLTSLLMFVSCRDFSMLMLL